MERIIYISTVRGECDDGMIADILARSRFNNGRDGLTGLLVIGGRRFLQAIEGPRETLDNAYRRIKADPRHYALVQLERRPIEQRSFPAWSMGCDQAASGGANLATMIERLTEHIDDASLQAHLRSFAEFHSKAA